MTKIKINFATAKELEALPGVGPTLARRIVKERIRNGDYERGRDLKAVKGLDVEKVKDFKGLVSYERSSQDFIDLIEEKIKKNFWTTVDGAFADLKDWFTDKSKIKTSKKRKRKRSTISIPRKKNSAPVSVPEYKGDMNSEKRLSDEDIQKVALKEKIDFSAIKAVIEVESNGKGYLDNGNPKILFEGHVFWRELKSKRINPEQYLRDHSDILYPHWNKRHYRGGMGEYDRLNKAVRIHKECALRSASWGMFQIMGFNYKAAGYDTVEAFVKSVYISEAKQLESFMTFIKSKDLVRYIRQKDWSNFARGYNGNGYKANRYDERLSEANKRFANKSWA